jgi:hypothetical protein
LKSKVIRDFAASRRFLFVSNGCFCVGSVPEVSQDFTYSAGWPISVKTLEDSILRALKFELHRSKELEVAIEAL